MACFSSVSILSRSRVRPARAPSAPSTPSEAQNLSELTLLATDVTAFLKISRITCRVRVVDWAGGFEADDGLTAAGQDTTSVPRRASDLLDSLFVVSET